MMQKGMGELKEQDAEFQIFVEAWISAAAAKKTIVLEVKSTTTVREVMEMLKKKVIPVAKLTLRTRAGKYLLQQDLSLAECGVGKEATLILPCISYLIEQIANSANLMQKQRFSKFA